MANSKHPFTVSIDDDLIVVKRFGVQVEESVKAIRREVKRLMAADKSRRKILVIVKSDSSIDMLSTKASIQSLKEIPYERIAIVASIPQRIAGAKGVVQASRVKERARIFRDEEDARAWLAEEA